MKRRQLIALASIVVAACVDGGRSSGPSFAISDAVTGDIASRNPYFFWLPPLVPDPLVVGEFNPFAAPVVTVCQLSPTGTACATDDAGKPIVVAEFTTTSGTGSEIIRVNAVDEHYIVNWHTDMSSLDPALVYRVTVSLDGKSMGYADVEVGPTGTELKNVNRDEFVPLVDGRTLPLKFRIDAGAGCVGIIGGCTEVIVDPAVLDTVIVLDDNIRLAFGEFPAGWTNSPQLVRIERIPDAEFGPGEGPLGTDFPQYPLFFHYVTTAPDSFNLPVRIGVCNVEDPDDDPYHPHHRGTTVLAMGATPAEFRTLEGAPTADILDNCAGAGRQESAIGLVPSSLGELAARVGKFTASLIAPRALQASAMVVDGGAGGSTEAFTPAGTVDTATAPDLSARDLSVSPSSPTSADAVTLGAVVTNSGTASAGSAAVNICAVQVFDEGTSSVCQALETPTLAAGASAPLSARFTDLAAGAYTVVATVDSPSVVFESDETNNRADGPAFVVTAAPPVIDGILSAGEWDGATQTNFTVNVPLGTTPGTLYVMNDGQNLYLAVRFARSVVDAVNLLNFEFDLDNDGSGPENGDEYVTFTTATGLSDAFRSTCGDIIAGCVTTDRLDGAGAFGNNETYSVYEISRPLNSGEVGKDFAITPPATIGMLLQLAVGTADTRFPTGTFPTYVPITITAPSP